MIADGDVGDDDSENYEDELLKWGHGDGKPSVIVGVNMATRICLMTVMMT